MTKGYLGVDTGSISTKGVLVDDKGDIIWSKYIWTEGNPIAAVKAIVADLEAGGFKVAACGTTGSARKLAGAILNADVVKNEITAHAVGTLNKHPDVKTIFEIGGQDSKIIIIDDGVVVDYAMNTLCAAGTGSFLSSQAARLGVDINDFGQIALTASHPAKIAARCTVFAESDLVHKAQTGYKKEDIILGLCHAVVGNYLNNLSKGKSIKPPIVFQGGVSRNKGVVKAFESVTGQQIIVDQNGHLMGALGAALLAKNALKKHDFNFEVALEPFETRAKECNRCANNCELINVFRNGKLIDVWGSRCGRAD